MQLSEILDLSSERGDGLSYCLLRRLPPLAGPDTLHKARVRSKSRLILLELEFVPRERILRDFRDGRSGRGRCLYRA
jgi:hypothetical protein